MRPDESPQQFDQLPASVRNNDKVRAALARLAASGALAGPTPPAAPPELGPPQPEPPKPPDVEATEPAQESWLIKAVPDRPSPPIRPVQPVAPPTAPPAPLERPAPRDVEPAEPAEGSWMVRPTSVATGPHRRWSAHPADSSTATAEDEVAAPITPPRSVRRRHR